MSASASTEQTETRGEALFGLMAGGIIVLTGLIAMIGVVGQWWVLAGVFATLLGTTGVVLFAIGRLLGEEGDGVADSEPARTEVATVGERSGVTLPTVPRVVAGV